MNKIYNLGMNILAVCVFFVLPLILLFSKKRRASILKRAGFSMEWEKKRPREKRLWVHALSLGEVRSSLPLIRALKKQYPENTLIFTTSTKTGFDLAHQLFYADNNKIVDQIGYFPFDIAFIVRKTISQIAPNAVIIIETDIWPNFICEAQKQKIPVTLVNARLSVSSLKGYLFFKKFFSKVFSGLDAVLVQSQVDADRFRQLSIPDEKIEVAGNIKFDQPVPDQAIPAQTIFDQTIENRDLEFISKIKSLSGVSSETQILLAGSTHEGEEEILCRVFKQLLRSLSALNPNLPLASSPGLLPPNLLMMIAPRNPERCREISSLLLSEKISSVLFSDIQEYKQSDDKYYPQSGNAETVNQQSILPVILIDIMGILSRLYAVCNVAFIGGTFVKEGGHNPLEPAAFAKPVLFGPDMSDFLWISEQLIQNGGAVQPDSEKTLTKELEKLFKNPELQREMGEKNREVFSDNTGAVEKILQFLGENL